MRRTVITQVFFPAPSLSPRKQKHDTDFFLPPYFHPISFHFTLCCRKFIRNINFYFPTNASLLFQNMKTKLVWSLKRTSLKVFLSFITPHPHLPTPKHPHSLLSGWAAWHNILIWDPQSDGMLYQFLYLPYLSSVMVQTDKTISAKQLSLIIAVTTVNWWHNQFPHNWQLPVSAAPKFL